MEVAAGIGFLIALAVRGGHRHDFPPAGPGPAAERAERSEASEAAVEEPADKLGDTFLFTFPPRCLGSLQAWFFLFHKGRPWKKTTQLAQQHVFHLPTLDKLEAALDQT